MRKYDYELKILDVIDQKEYKKIFLRIEMFIYFFTKDEKDFINFNKYYNFNNSNKDLYLQIQTNSKMTQLWLSENYIKDIKRNFYLNSIDESEVKIFIEDIFNVLKKNRLKILLKKEV